MPDLPYLDHVAVSSLDRAVVLRRWWRLSLLGCLLGGAVGDALGAPVEFLSRHLRQTHHTHRMPFAKLFEIGTGIGPGDQNGRIEPDLLAMQYGRFEQQAGADDAEADFHSRSVARMSATCPSLFVKRRPHSLHVASLSWNRSVIPHWHTEAITRPGTPATSA